MSELKPGCCKDCKHRQKISHPGYGDVSICSNRGAMDEGRGQANTDEMMIYEHSEGGLFFVGDKFGCVHFENK